MEQNTLPSKLIALNRAIAKFGSMAGLARALGVSSFRVVQAWKRTRVPAEYCPHIEELTAVRCEDLRSDVRWHVLRTKPRGCGKAVKSGPEAGV